MIYPRTPWKTACSDASPREREILADGGKLPHTKKHAEAGGAASAAD